MRQLLSAIFMLLSVAAKTQDTLTIEQCLSLADTATIESKIIEKALNYKAIEYLIFRRSVLPQVSLTTSLPYQRSIQEIVLANGGTSLLERNFTSPISTLSTRMILPFTGGELNISNSLGLNNDFNNKKKSFSSNWINVGYSQSITGFNQYKWLKKKFAISRALDTIQHHKSKAEVRTQISKMYVSALLLQGRCMLTSQNISKSKILLEIVDERVKLGRTIELEATQLRSLVAQLQLRYKTDSADLALAKLTLAQNLGLDDADFRLAFIKPVKISFNEEEITALAVRNGFDGQSRFKLLEMNEKIEKLKRENSPQVYFQAGVGVNSTANELDKLLDLPAKRYSFSTGITLPLLTWQIPKQKMKMLKIEKEILGMTTDAERRDLVLFSKKLYQNFRTLESQIVLAESDMKLQEVMNAHILELLTAGRKTAMDYKNQLFDYEKSVFDFQQLIANLFLLKMSLDELTLK